METVLELASKEGPTELMLAKVKNASGRIGIFSILVAPHPFVVSLRRYVIVEILW